MNYLINKKNIKQSVQNLSSFFKEKGFDIPRNVLLDAFSKSLFYKNWNTLEGLSTKPDRIKNYPNKRAYMIEIECDLTKENLLTLLKKSFEEGKCNAIIENVLSEKNVHHFEIAFPVNSDNFLTSMFLLVRSLKNDNVKVKRFDLLRIMFEKESLLRAMDLINVS